MAVGPRIMILARTMTRIGVSGNEPTNPDPWPRHPQEPAGGKRKASPERGQAAPQSQGTATVAAHKKGPRQSRGQSSGASRPPPCPVSGGRPPGLVWYDGPRAGYIGGGRLFSAYHKSLQFARRWMGGVAPTWRLHLATSETVERWQAPVRSTSPGTINYVAASGTWLCPRTAFRRCGWSLGRRLEAVGQPIKKTAALLALAIFA